MKFLVYSTGYKFHSVCLELSKYGWAHSSVSASIILSVCPPGLHGSLPLRPSLGFGVGPLSTSFTLLSLFPALTVSHILCQLYLDGRPGLPTLPDDQRHCCRSGNEPDNGHFGGLDVDEPPASAHQKPS